MLRLGKNKILKGQCSKLIILWITLAVILSLVTNTRRSFSETSMKRDMSMNSLAFAADGTTLNYNAEKPVKDVNKMYIHTKSTNIGKQGDRVKHMNNNEIQTVTGRETNIKKRDLNDEIQGFQNGDISLSSEAESRRTGRSPVKANVKNKLSWGNNFNEEDGIEFEDEMHDESEVAGLEDSKNNSSPVVIDHEWVKALRTRTTRPGILRKRNLHWTIGMAGNYCSSLFSPPPGEIPRQRFPKAVVIGVGHCGTRALIEFLKMHPHIVPSNSEVHFFDNDVNFFKGYGWYKEQMPLSYSNQMTIEKTPCYIWSDRALNEIYKMNRKMKLIIIVKDPVSRLVSMKLSHHPNEINSLHLITVNEILQVNFDSQALIRGVYVKYVKRWLQKYPPSQIHIIEGSEFEREPAMEMNKLESFLEVPHLITEKNFYFNETKGFYCKVPLHLSHIECLNHRKGREHPKMDSTLEKILYDYYRSYNEELFELLGRRFDWDPKSHVESADSGNLSVGEVKRANTEIEEYLESVDFQKSHIYNKLKQLKRKKRDSISEKGMLNAE